MRLVIADTGPVNYLILIGQIDLLPRMFEQIALPVAVQAELSDPIAPQAVQSWIAAPPAWLEIHDTAGLPQVSGLDDGETAAIALAWPKEKAFLSPAHSQGALYAVTCKTPRDFADSSSFLERPDPVNKYLERWVTN